MKKTFFITGIIFYSISGFSQKADTPIQGTPTKEMTPLATEERIIRLEAEIAALKTSQVETKKQLSQLQSALLSAGKKSKKPVINRVGSKQVN